MAVSQTVSRPPRQRNSPLVLFLRLIILAGIAALLLASLLAIMLLALQFALQDRIVPGVSVDGLDLSGMTEAEALIALTYNFSELADATYTFRDGERTWQARSGDLGLQLAAGDMLQRALAIGHVENGIGDLVRQADAWFKGESVPLMLTMDENVALEFLTALAAEINREGRDASLSIVDTDVRVDTGAKGRKLDIPGTLVRLTATLLATMKGDIELVVDENLPRLWNVAEAALLVDNALSGSVQLIATDAAGEPLGPWTITSEQIRALLQVTLGDYGTVKRFDVAFNEQAFAGFLQSLAPSLTIVPVDGRFDFDPQSGQLVPLRHWVGGRALNVDKTIEKLEAAVFNRESRVVPMEFEYWLPSFHDGVNAADLGIKELVAQATSYYWGSWQNRRTNIEIGADKLNGVIIAPGEEFSFNRYLGDITPEAGFVDGAVIFGGSTVTGIGGGICQVSTTAFRAAFSGGYAISERNSHGYRVGYYEYAGAGPGLDAAIWQPTSDFRFINNSPYHLLIETEFMSAKDALQFRFYSTRHWNTVVEPPIIRDVVDASSEGYRENPDLLPGQVRQVDYAAAGADVWVYRNVYDTQGNLIKRDQTFTHYSPWQAVFEVAPRDPRLEEAEEDLEQE